MPVICPGQLSPAKPACDSRGDMAGNGYGENAALLRRIAEGDAEAADELIASNMGLVKNIALRFRDRGVDYEDLVQIGAIGMIKAVRSYDFKYNTAFSTYAVPLIIGEIRRFLRDDGIIKVGRTQKRQGIHVLKQKEAFIRQYGREPRLSELADFCKISTEELAAALEAVGPVLSFDEPTGDDEDGPTLENMVGSTDSAIERSIDRIALEECIQALPPLQRRIIALRYFRELSQQQTGELLGLTQVKVSREEKKIIQRLREELGVEI